MATVSVAMKNGKSAKASKNGQASSALALLKSASKPTGPVKRDPYTFDGNIAPLASKVLLLGRQIDEMERELKLAKQGVREDVDQWYRERLAANGYESSVRVPAGKDILRLTYQHRYLKLPAEQEDHIRGIVGEKYDTYFQPGATVKIRKAISENPEELNKVVLRLAKALGEKDFAEIFEAEQTVLPTKTFTEQRYRELDSKTNAALELAGVVQVVSFGEGK